MRPFQTDYLNQLGPRKPGQVICTLELGEFSAICVPYILGKKSNPSYLVGGTPELSPPEPVGYRLSTFCFGNVDRVIIGAEIRLFANAKTPTYHVIVGDVTGSDAVMRVVQKLGGVSIQQLDGSQAVEGPGRHHWSPSVWPLVFEGPHKDPMRFP